MADKTVKFEKESEVLKALGHPVRLKMVFGLIQNNECNVNEIVEGLKLPQSTISQHLGVLKSRGIIECRKEGVKTCYKVVNKKVLEIVEILKK